MDKKRQQQAYENYVKQKTPVHNLPANMTKAFVTGGAICVLGQIITDFFVVIAIQGHNTGYHLTFFVNDAVLAVIAGQDQCIFHRSHIYEISIALTLIIRTLG